jgi:hypothetical protein
MPTETRKIQFTADEIRAALIHYALRTEMRLPKEGIDKVRFAKDGANVTFIYGRNPDGEKREVIFTEQQVGAAILLYCHTRGFPMPRAAEKVVRNEGDGTSMLIRLVHTES